MSRKMDITFAESAISDLQEIRDWYREQLVPEVGERLITELFNQVERLADFPESGRTVPEFNISNLREIVHPPFRIVYRMETKRLRIVRVWRSERLLKIAT